MDDGRGEISLNNFEPLNLEELPSQTVFPAHPGADQTTAEVLLDLASVRTPGGFAHFTLFRLCQSGDLRELIGDRGSLRGRALRRE